jgi:hypothetical protein
MADHDVKLGAAEEISSVTEQIASIAGPLQELLAAVSAIGGGGEPVGTEMMEEEHEVEAMDDAAEDGVELMEDEEEEVELCDDPESKNPLELSASGDEIAQLRAEISNLRDDNQKLREERELDKIVVDGCATLRAYGVDAKTAEKEIREVAKDLGNKKVGVWLKAKIDGRTPAPGMPTSEFAVSANDPVLADYAGDDEMFEQAAKLSASYDELEKQNSALARRQTKADFIKKNIERIKA